MFHRLWKRQPHRCSSAQRRLGVELLEHRLVFSVDLPVNIAEGWVIAPPWKNAGELPLPLVYEDVIHAHGSHVEAALSGERVAYLFLPGDPLRPIGQPLLDGGGDLEVVLVLFPDADDFSPQGRPILDWDDFGPPGFPPPGGPREFVVFERVPRDAFEMYLANGRPPMPDHMANRTLPVFETLAAAFSNTLSSLEELNQPASLKSAGPSGSQNVSYVLTSDILRPPGLRSPDLPSALDMVSIQMASAQSTMPADPVDGQLDGWIELAPEWNSLESGEAGSQTVSKDENLNSEHAANEGTETATFDEAELRRLLHDSELTNVRDEVLWSPAESGLIELLARDFQRYADVDGESGEQPQALLEWAEMTEIDSALAMYQAFELAEHDRGSQKGLRNRLVSEIVDSSTDSEGVESNTHASKAFVVIVGAGCTLYMGATTFRTTCRACSRLAPPLTQAGVDVAVR